MKENKKPITKSFMVEALRSGRVSLPPLSFALMGTNPPQWHRLDAVIEGHWGKSSVTFIAEIRALSTPKAFAEGVALLKAADLPKQRPPLLIMPFLSQAQLQELEREGINGLDLCGNGVISVPPTLTILRTGNPNRFPSYAPIKNVYRKNSSMVGRVLLSRPQFPAVKVIVEEIARRDVLATATGKSTLTFGTVSKALSRMEADLIVTRDPNGITLLQPDRLLEMLSRNYVPPPGVTASLKINRTVKELPGLLADAAERIGAPVAATGLSSVARYAVMQRDEKLSIYCPRGEALLELLGPVSSPTTRFPNLEILDTHDSPLFFFDAREENGFLWASPVQTYLELMAGDKRDQETAGQTRSLILSAIEVKRP